MNERNNKKKILAMLHDKHTPPTTEAGILAFDEWIKNNPAGGVFEFAGKRYSIIPKQQAT